MDCKLIIDSYSLRLAVVYRPPSTRENGLKTSAFLDHEWPLFLARYATVDNNIIIVGAVSIHLDIPADRDTLKFTSVLESCGMRQHVSEPTHVGGHTLDVVITRDTDNMVSDIEVTDPGLSDNTGKASRDHFAVFFNTRAFKPAPVMKTVSFRKLHSINVDAFKNNILTSDILKSSLQSTNTEELVNAYNDELSSLINKHALH